MIKHPKTQNEQNEQTGRLGGRSGRANERTGILADKVAGENGKETGGYGSSTGGWYGENCSGTTLAGLGIAILVLLGGHRTTGAFGRTNGQDGSGANGRFGCGRFQTAAMYTL